MNPSEKRYAKSAQKTLIFESGLAVLEMRQSKMETLYERMIEQYRARLEDFDPCSDENQRVNYSGRSYAFTLRDIHVEAFKASIVETNGKKMWNAFMNLKSELVNHWLPHFKVQSGEDLDDAVERVRVHAWAFRANRIVKKQQEGRVRGKGSRDGEERCRRINRQ